MTQVAQVLHTLRQHGVDGRGVVKCRGCVRGIAEIGIQSDSQQSVWGAACKSAGTVCEPMAKSAFNQIRIQVEIRLPRKV